MWDFFFGPFFPYQARTGIGPKIGFQRVSNKYMPRIEMGIILDDSCNHYANHKYS
jgi:hypothetical protein